MLVCKNKSVCGLRSLLLPTYLDVHKQIFPIPFALTLNVQNDCIFQHIYLPTDVIIEKEIRLIFHWAVLCYESCLYYERGGK